MSAALHPVKRPEGTRSGPYCGPTSIAGITGAPLDVIYKKFRSVRKKAGGRLRAYRENRDGCYRPNGPLIPIRGTSKYECLEVLRLLGWKLKQENRASDRCATLGQFCEDRGHMGPYLVNVTGHWVAVSGGKVLCTSNPMTEDGLQPIPVGDYPRKARRIVRWYLLKPPRSA